MQCNAHGIINGFEPNPNPSPNLVHDDGRALLGALDLLDVSLDGVDGDLVWRVDVVPDAQVASVLRHHHVAVGHPLHVRAEVQQLRPGLQLQVVDMQEAPLVPEEQQVCATVQLQPVHLGVVRDGHRGLRAQVLHADRLRVQQERDLLVVEGI
jgi:hypothetical protein